MTRLRCIVVFLLAHVSSSELATEYCGEELALEYIRSDNYNEMSLKDDLKSVLMHGWWTAAEELIRKGREAGVSLTSVVYQAKSKINNKMKEMTRLLKLKAVSVIHPAFEWAQSTDTVMLNVKLAHKLDTPATLDCVASDQTVSFTSQRISFKADCTKTNKAFVLELDLWGEIDPELSTWAFGSVGRVNINLRKASQVVWRRLLSSASKPGNMHTWWAVQAKHDTELAELGRINNEKKEEEANMNSTDTNETDVDSTNADDMDATDLESPAEDMDAASEGDESDGENDADDESKKKRKKKKGKKKKKKKKKKKRKKKSKTTAGDAEDDTPEPPKVVPPKIDL